VTGRVDGPDKVTGRARYAFEHPVDGAAYVWAVPSVIARGTIRSVDAAGALALPGVLAVITPDNAPRLPGTDDPELALFQARTVAYRGQFVAAAVAETLEVAREAAGRVVIDYEQAAHDVTLTEDHPGLYKPDFVNPRYETDTAAGDFDGAFAAAAVRVDATYRTPAEHNHPMEPHATVAVWRGGTLTVYDATQGPSRTAGQVAAVFGLEPGQVRVIAEHVGGGFGAKGMPRANVILAAMAAKVTGRPVKCAVTRPQMFAVTGHRAPSIQRVRLGAGPDGRLTALCHDVIDQTSTLKEFTEQSAVATRHMYAAPHRRTTHRVVRLDVPTPSWMRAPGECPGMFALESAMDELAEACGVDPVELRLRNEPPVHPETGQPFSSRHLAGCLREGAARFGWAGRDPAPGVRRAGSAHRRWLTGTGVAASTYPARAMPSQARVTVSQAGRYQVSIAAADIGTGARTALLAVAAEALGVPEAAIDLRIGDSALPPAMIAGGSMGTASWTWAVIKACRASPPAGTTADIGALASQPLGGRARYAFGAQFAEVRVDAGTGEVRVPRLLGVFAAGRIISPAQARSQLIGGMTMGLSMALHEESAMDPQFGDYPNHDLAGYHIAAHADVQDIDAVWIDEEEPDLGPAGAKGIGEVGIVGTAAAIASAVYHATGVRVRDLPIRLDKLLRRHP
jgi:xanthine dehydrogenase YagR molybdenum-binding subunit